MRQGPISDYQPNVSNPEDSLWFAVSREFGCYIGQITTSMRAADTAQNSLITVKAFDMP